MNFNINIPFSQVLQIVKSLTPLQKKQLIKELEAENLVAGRKEDFEDFLLNGPVFSENEVKSIEATTKSIAQWRTKK